MRVTQVCKLRYTSTLVLLENLLDKSCREQSEKWDNFFLDSYEKPAVNAVSVVLPEKR